MDAASQRQVLRVPLQAIVSGCAGIVFAAMAFFAPPGPHRTWIDWFLTGLFLVVAVRALRGAVILTPHELVCRNIFSTRRVARGNVVSADLAAVWVLGGIRTVRVRTQSGRGMSASMLAPGSTRSARRQAAHAIDAINAWVAEYDG